MRDNQFMVECSMNDTKWKTMATKTKYGYTANLFDKLQLHMGKHLFLKRGGAKKAFCFDSSDYRYETLMGILGLPHDEHCTYMLGTLLDV